MDIKSLCKSFVNGVENWFDMEFIPLDAPVLGVSFVPIHLYARGDASLIGKKCVVLGKERGGIYANKLNFFGGKTSDKTKRFCTGSDVAQVLFEEVYEELHIALSPCEFGNALIKCFTIPYEAGVSLVFVVHVTGLSRSVWEKEHTKRQQSNAPWKFVEMSAMEHVPIDELQKQSCLSHFVELVAHNISVSCVGLSKHKGVHYRKFMSVSVRAQEVVVQ
jgi:8-oxo-dGTP pyrophosphatase MutT (NUDIX family)